MNTCEVSAYNNKPLKVVVRFRLLIKNTIKQFRRLLAFIDHVVKHQLIPTREQDVIGMVIGPAGTDVQITFQAEKGMPVVTTSPFQVCTRHTCGRHTVRTARHHANNILGTPSLVEAISPRLASLTSRAGHHRIIAAKIPSPLPAA